MCGVSAVFLNNDNNVNSNSTLASNTLVEMLTYLQHRGQDSAGVITCGSRARLNQCKGLGVVNEVFKHLNSTNKLLGSFGVGHVRYPTAGSSSTSLGAEVQPFYVNSPYGIVLAHNGNLVNSSKLKEFLDHNAHRHINTDSDSELLLNVFADHLQQTGKFRINEYDTFEALKGMMNLCVGGYACTGLIAGFGIIGFRDPNGIRPLVFGQRRNKENKLEYAFASESVALEGLGFMDFSDVLPGEAIIVTKEKVSRKILVRNKPYTPCIFEYVYFARPDSIINNVSVYQSRVKMGELLAKTIMNQLDMDSFDVVIPVPETSRVSALQVAKITNKPYREGFMKNRYIGRTFIMPNDDARKRGVRRKLNVMRQEFKDKRVLLVDDSIVRGTTSKEIIQMVREAGAKKVYLASCSPAIKYPNVYGIDMPTHKELVAYKKNIEEIEKTINADRIIYQEMEDLIQACKEQNPEIVNFETSVFNGEYVTGDINDEYFKELEMNKKMRNGENKSELTKPNGHKHAKISDEDMGLYNYN